MQQDTILAYLDGFFQQNKLSCFVITKYKIAIIICNCKGEKMKKNLLRINLCLMCLIVSGCSLIDSLKYATTPKTSFEFEVSESADNYAILEPIGLTMTEVDKYSKINFNYDANYVCVEYCIDNKNIDSDYRFAVGDQVSINFDENGYDKNKAIIKMTSMDVVSAKDINENDFSLYTLLNSLRNEIYGYEVHDLKSNYDGDSKSNSINIQIDEKMSSSLITYLYVNADVAKAQIQKLANKDTGDIKSVKINKLVTYFVKGRLIVALTPFKDETEEETSKMYDILRAYMGEPYKQFVAYEESN